MENERNKQRSKETTASYSVALQLSLGPISVAEKEQYLSLWYVRITERGEVDTSERCCWNSAASSWVSPCIRSHYVRADDSSVLRIKTFRHSECEAVFFPHRQVFEALPPLPCSSLAIEFNRVRPFIGARLPPVTRKTLKLRSDVGVCMKAASSSCKQRQSSHYSQVSLCHAPSHTSTILNGQISSGNKLMAMSRLRGGGVEREKYINKRTGRSKKKKKRTLSAAHIKTNYLNSPTLSLSRAPSLFSPALRRSPGECAHVWVGKECAGVENVRTH